MVIAGRCHCGNLSFALTWEPDPVEIPARACGCTFCVKHGNLWTATPDAALEVAVREPSLVSRYAFETLGYRRYEWKCNSHNAPSQRAALRYGFVFEGVMRAHMIAKGRNRDTAMFSMLDSEWPVRKANFERWLAPENFVDGRQIASLGAMNGVAG